MTPNRQIWKISHKLYIDERTEPIKQLVSLEEKLKNPLHCRVPRHCTTYAGHTHKFKWLHSTAAANLKVLKIKMMYLPHRKQHSEVWVAQHNVSRNKACHHAHSRWGPPEAPDRRCTQSRQDAKVSGPQTLVPQHTLHLLIPYYGTEDIPIKQQTHFTCWYCTMSLRTFL